MEVVYISRAVATVELDADVLSRLVDFTMTWCEISQFHAQLASEGFWVGESKPISVDGEMGANFPVYRLVNSIKETNQIGYLLTTREERQSPSFK